jgi:hypothetical protein
MWRGEACRLNYGDQAGPLWGGGETGAHMERGEWEEVVGASFPSSFVAQV